MIPLQSAATEDNQDSRCSVFADPILGLHQAARLVTDVGEIVFRRTQPVLQLLDDRPLSRLQTETAIRGRLQPRPGKLVMGGDGRDLDFRAGRPCFQVFLGPCAALRFAHVVLGLGSCCCTDAHFACSCETRDSILSASSACGSVVPA